MKHRPMLGVTDIWTYLAATIVVILLPGPNSMYVLSVSARRGVADGYRAAAAVFCGDGILMVASAAGVASLLKASPILFLIVKIAGACYLALLGFNLIRGGIKTWRGKTSEQPEEQPAVVEGERPFVRALFASLLNPKAILFFVAFFVQFIDPTYPYPVLSFLILACIVHACSLTYLSVLIFSGNALANAFRARPRVSSIGTTGVGAAMLGFAAKLSTSSM